MPPREAIALLEDALAQIEDLNTKAALHSLNALLDDRDRQAIFERRFEILGEAFARLARRHREIFLTIEGAAAAVAVRNIIAHGYDSVDHRILWSTVEMDLSATEASLRSALTRLREA